MLHGITGQTIVTEVVVFRLTSYKTKLCTLVGHLKLINIILFTDDYWSMTIH